MLPVIAWVVAMQSALLAQSALEFPPRNANGATNRCGAPITSGLVGWWPLDTLSGGISPDLSGNGNAMTAYNSPTLVTAVITNGVSFNAASSQYLEANDASASWPYGAAARTTCLWFSGIADQPCELMGYGPNDPLERWGMFYDANILYLECESIYIGFSWTHDSGTHFLCFTYPGGGALSTATLYLDGVAQTISASSGSGSTPNTGDGNPLDLGRISGQSVDYVTGIEDDARLYNRALSSTEVNEIYENGLPGVSGLTGLGCP